MARDTGRLPKALESMPEVFQDVSYVTDAFMVLTSSRTAGFGEGPIPLTEIQAYVTMFPIPDDMETFIRLLRAMDNEYLAAQSKKVKPDGNSTQTRN